MKTRTSLILCALAVLGLVAVQPAHALTIYWDEEGTTKSWNTATNWSDDLTPSSANEYVLDLVGMTATYGLDANFTIQTLTLNAASMTDLDANTVGVVGQTLILNGSGSNPLITVGTSANAAVNIGANGGVGTLSITLAASGNIDVAGAKTLTIKSVIDESGAQSLTKTGDGTLTLSGANLYTGLTTVSAGKLLYGASDVLSTGGVTVNGSTAILDLGASQTDSVGTVTLQGGGQIIGTGTSALTSTGTFEMQNGSVSAILAGGVALNKTTAGTATLSGANTYTGTTTVNDGILRAGSTTAFGPAANANLAFGPASTGTVQLNGNSMQVIGLNTDAGSPGTTYVQNGAGGAATLTINNAGANTFAGVFQKGAAGNLALTKIGAGKLTLTGNSGAASIGGNVTVNAGSLEISGGGKLSNNEGRVNGSGASATVTGSGSRWDSSGYLIAGENTSNNTLTISGGAQVSCGNDFGAGWNTGANYNTVIVTGSGTNLSAPNGMQFGRQGSYNTMTISDGATVSTFIFYMSGGRGNPADASNNTFTVTDPGSTFNVTPANWDIGDRGAGNQFNVLNGGVVTMNPFGYVGWFGGSAMAIVVDGAGSVWNTTGGVDFGNGSSGHTATVSPDISSVFSGFQWREGLSVGIEGFAMSLDPTRKAIRNDRV